MTWQHYKLVCLKVKHHTGYLESFLSLNDAYLLHFLFFSFFLSHAHLFQGTLQYSKNASRKIKALRCFKQEGKDKLLKKLYCSSNVLYRSSSCWQLIKAAWSRVFTGDIGVLRSDCWVKHSVQSAAKMLMDTGTVMGMADALIQPGQGRF